ncbi:hypothetical protein GGGNBK_13735 [Sporosarcina sp. ANT_H38]
MWENVLGIIRGDIRLYFWKYVQSIDVVSYLLIEIFRYFLMKDKSLPENIPEGSNAFLYQTVNVCLIP